jgi:hypothetical protein
MQPHRPRCSIIFMVILTVHVDVLVVCQEFQYYNLVNLISRLPNILLYSSDTADHIYVMIRVYCKKRRTTLQETYL